MKKTLRLFFVAVLAMVVGNVMADDVTMAYSGTTTTNMTGDNDAALVGLDATKWNVVGSKGKASNFPGLNKDGSIRMYYHAGGSNTITVESSEGATINTISMTFTGSNYSNVTVTAEGSAVTPNDGVYTINSSSFVLGNGNTSNVQVQIKQITINYSASSDTRTSTTIQFADGYLTRATKGKDASIALPAATVKAGDATVSGATIAWSSDKTDIAEVSGNNLVIKDLGETTIKADFAGDATYKPSSKSYKLTVYKGYLSLEELVTNVTNGNEKWDKGGEFASYWLVDEGHNPMTNTVVYANGQNIYLTDGTNNLLLYGTNSKNLKQGDVISCDLGGGKIGAIWGTLLLYNKLPEFSFTDMDVKVVSEGASIQPKTITADKIGDNINVYVKIENAVYQTAFASKNATFKVGETTFTVRQNWTNIPVTDLVVGNTYTLEGMGAIYNTTPQLYFMKATDTSTGINDVKVVAAEDENAPVFNLAGQKVNANYKGVVIKGGKKMIVK